MEEPKLILNDGTEIVNGSAWNVRGDLWVTYKGGTFADAVAIALDHEKTSCITYEHEGESDVFEGFTDCTSVNLDLAGNITIILRRE